MDPALLRLCDAYDDKKITLEEFHAQLILLRARRNEQYRRRKQEAKGKG